MFYEVLDTHGVPQCGCEILRFEEFWEVIEYIDENPDVMERIEDGYATIREVRS